jgi:transcriptional antiterminator NusG
MWYVIQTLSSKEEKVKRYLEYITPSGLYDDCRIVYYEIERRYKGEWHKESKRMFPGYLFMITDEPETLMPYLRNCPEPSRILMVDGVPAPLLPHEEQFLKTLTDQGETVSMSVGIKEGDKIIVSQGFLKGRESYIRRIDRHKRRAWIEVDLLGETRLAEVGLEVVKKVEPEEPVKAEWTMKPEEPVDAEEPVEAEAAVEPEEPVDTVSCRGLLHPER